MQPSLELDALGGMPIPMHGNELNELGAFELPSCGHHDAHLQNLGPCQLDGPLPNQGDVGFVESMHMLGSTQGNQLFGQSLFSEGHQSPTLQPHEHEMQDLLQASFQPMMPLDGEHLQYEEPLSNTMIQHDQGNLSTTVHEVLGQSGSSGATVGVTQATACGSGLHVTSQHVGAFDQPSTSRLPSTSHDHFNHAPPIISDFVAHSLPVEHHGDLPPSPAMFVEPSANSVDKHATTMLHGHEFVAHSLPGDLPPRPLARTHVVAPEHRLLDESIPMSAQQLDGANTLATLEPAGSTTESSIQPPVQALAAVTHKEVEAPLLTATQPGELPAEVAVVNLPPF